MDTFTVRDLRERTGELVRDAEAGKLSVVTKHGRPVFVALPFDENVLQNGLALAFAVHLFDTEVLPLERAARVAGLPVGAFMEKLGDLGIAVVRYPPEDLDEELAVLSAVTGS
ncbi:MAG: type II toxin-antitoxin system Phd/YefM family antitoxin [Acidobacteriota bacterium]|nr:type II toxin-antitoxin system Phd/YefM family antitoxin [Acidobacteriota bacterium]